MSVWNTFEPGIINHIVTSANSNAIISDKTVDELVRKTAIREETRKRMRATASTGFLGGPMDGVLSTQAPLTDRQFEATDKEFYTTFNGTSPNADLEHTEPAYEEDIITKAPPATRPDPVQLAKPTNGASKDASDGHLVYEVKHNQKP